ncbi:hypothetical protein ACFFX1_50915 [Dactylosporangium sucinum]|uniref:Uncharacterized protein n=1 Tax=Dactylosporangium sucinum TaxID=1424081 RepID=A0A917U2W2_9ACTN|nr:hypothetical protein [Dactylosporangium sucinum]GGM54381.1 hypothetical protein GCM10007977_064990 [Dactylosporangium sucinum]
MSAPTRPAESQTFSPGDRVWIPKSGVRRAGIVVCSSPDAATVRYRPTEGRGTGVDTVTAEDVTTRSDADPLLDSTLDFTLSRRIPIG